jgi:hypothetical protein
MTDAPIEAVAVERYAKPDLSTAREESLPALFQERFIVRFAYGLSDMLAERQATRTLDGHPDFFLTYEDAESWGKAHCPVGLAFGVTKLTARVSQAEIEKYAPAD